MEQALAACHGDKLPDPARNAILAVCAVSRDERKGTSTTKDQIVTFRVSPAPRNPDYPGVSFFRSEIALLDGLASFVNEVDPDIITGFETQTSSIGFILERAISLNHPFSRLVSRIDESGAGGTRSFGAQATEPMRDSAAAAYFKRKGMNIGITGRHILNLWRIVRSEVKLASYTLEGVALELLRVTISKHKPRVIESWLARSSSEHRAHHHLRRHTTICLAIIDKLDILGRTGELARVFGVDFMSVLTRGSQFRVESMMARVAHERGFALLAAQRDQVFSQPAVEALPLVMEPMSAFYVDPVIVLDFQSLYPSMIIAHNLCFSTALGNLNRISSWGEPRHLGVVQNYTPPPSIGNGFNALTDVFVAPNGEMFATAAVRRGILPQMLAEVLETRVMVKTALKGIRGDEQTARLLNARQFGLKMIANVTYGYASASFSGRMPCSGLADAIVQCGRDALERMIRFVDGELHSRTGVSVVYGDTDSLFVRVPGGTREQAFEIGEEIVRKASEMFPAPVTLQLEKVYHPCVLQTKKRYVGYAYESREQTVPTFDAKGIETVRRDSCALVQKTMERVLRVLFETKDVSKVKRLVQRTCQRVLANRLPLSDFIFRKEVRLGSYKDGHLPPAAIVATRAMELDARAAPRHGERIAFVVIYEKPGAALKDSVVSPEQLLQAEQDGSARLNTTYYITKQILPVLHRVFSLLGVKVATWYAEMPRPYFAPVATGGRGGAASKRDGSKHNSLYRYYATERCVLCHGKGKGHRVCEKCVANTTARQSSLYVLAQRARALEEREEGFLQACLACIATEEVGAQDVQCTNLDCAVHFARHQLAIRSTNARVVLDDHGLWDKCE